MPPVPIPNWNAQGVIPPNDVASPTAGHRSPSMLLLYRIAEGSETYWETFLVSLLNCQNLLRMISKWSYLY
jgi:hypothetical protein